MSKRTYYTKSNKIISVDFSKMSVLISSNFTKLNLNDFLIINRKKLIELIANDKIISEHVGIISSNNDFKQLDLGYFCKEFLVKYITIYSDESIENMPITVSSNPFSWMIVYEHV